MRQELVEGRLYYYPKAGLYHYPIPDIYYDIGHSRFVQGKLEQFGGETESSLLELRGPPPSGPSSQSMPLVNYLQMMPPDDVGDDIDVVETVKAFNPLERAGQVGKEQVAMSAQRNAAKKAARKEARRNMWSNFKSGVTKMFETIPCEDWRKYMVNNYDMYKSPGTQSLNGCCTQYGCNSPIPVNGICDRDHEENAAFNNEAAKILLRESRSLAANHPSYDSSSNSADDRCAMVMREAINLLGDNNDWFIANCNSRNMPSGANISELDQAQSQSWASVSDISDNPMLQQDALKADFMRNTPSLNMIDRGPILDRVCQMCKEDDAMTPHLGWKSQLAVEAVTGTNVNRDIAMLSDWRRL